MRIVTQNATATQQQQADGASALRPRQLSPTETQGTSREGIDVQQNAPTRIPLTRTASSQADDTFQSIDKQSTLAIQPISQPNAPLSPIVKDDPRAAHDKSEPSLSEQLKRRDLDVRLYELANTVKGVRHTGHVMFEQMQGVTGKSLTVDREYDSEQNHTPVRQSSTPSTVEALAVKASSSSPRSANEKQQDQSIATLIQREVNKRALKASETAIRSEEESTQTNSTNNQQRDTDDPNNIAKVELRAQALENLSARQRLESILLASKTLPQYASALGYVNSDYPSGNSGLLDVFA